MGMDVSGVAPASPKGEYFRNNVWWWGPLATYVQHVAPELTGAYQYWHSNDGDGLDDVDSKLLAQILRSEIDSGRCQAYADQRAAELAALPRETCNLCDGTGVRTDEVGVAHGQPDMMILPSETRYGLGDGLNHDHPRYGQKGWCNGCNGVGSRESIRASYGFSVENVREFAEFLQDCGGFEIW
jgi:hypothetical protein